MLPNFEVYYCFLIFKYIYINTYILECCVLFSPLLVGTQTDFLTFQGRTITVCLYSPSHSLKALYRYENVNAKM